MLLLVFLVITGLFMIPFTAAAFYFFLGLRGYMIGKRESNRAKMIGGSNAMAYSLLALFVIVFLWFILVQDFLGIQI